MDKARIDEFEQRASELAQKASIDNRKNTFSSHYTATWPKQSPLRHTGIHLTLFYEVTSV